MNTASVLLAVLLTAAGANPAADSPTPWPKDGAGHRLVLVYRGVDREIDPAVEVLLAAFAAEYGSDGLGVSATVDLSPAAAGSLSPAPPFVRTDGPALALYAPDGAERLALTRDALDLFAVYRACESILRGRGRTSYAEHARSLLLQHLVGETPLLGADGAPSRPLAAVLGAGGPPCLFLPPGCGGCLLNKHAAGVAAVLASDPARGVLAFEPAALRALRRDGWTGAGYLLPADGAARILQLREAGVYTPLLVTGGPDGGLAVAPLTGDRVARP
jgi:hypothetical protein